MSKREKREKKDKKQKKVKAEKVKAEKVKAEKVKLEKIEKVEVEGKTEREVRFEELKRETRSVLVDKIIKDYELKEEEIGDCVELYYDCQTMRIQHQNRQRSEGEGELVGWLAYWLDLGEVVIAGKLKQWVEGEKASAETRWAYSQIGIGPVIAAGLAAHIDVNRSERVSSLWKFAGYAPGYDRRVRGERRVFNARLKTLCWKLGESFVKVSGKEGATYGKLYSQYKRDEVSKNENGQHEEAARRELATKKIKEAKTKETLLSGKLIDAHLHSRAKRKAIKIFLSHYWEVGRKARGLAVTEPYAIQVLGHDGKIEPQMT